MGTYTADALKTLKDLKHNDRVHNIPYAHITELRAEAIKWVKAITQADDEAWKRRREDFRKQNYVDVCCSFEVGGLYFEIGEDVSDVQGAIQFAKHFFNLTEEDLK